MKLLIAGSNGMIGSAVNRHLSGNGHEITRLARKTPGRGEIWWNPDNNQIDAASLEGFDGVIHLATMPWPLRWTVKAKQSIRANRLATNRLLAESLAGCARKPKTLICASGMGYYPSSGDAILTEDSPAGMSFLASLQHDGEAATTSANEAGIRVVHLRIPPVLGGPAIQRGALQAGDGQQWVSWVSRDELASIIEFALTTESLVGPVNAVSPNPLRNADFAAEVAQALGRKSVLALPTFLVRLLMGEMGDELILASRRIQPQRLMDAGYCFRFPTIDHALRHELHQQFQI